MKSTFKNVSTLLVAGLASMGFASAQSNALFGAKAPISEPTVMMESLHAEALVPLLDEMGLSYQGATLPTGEKILMAQAENGLKFQLTPTACDDRGTRCRGLHMLALFQTNAPSRTVSAFNYRYAFVSTGVDESGVAYISRYEVADYGMPRGNFAVAVGNYLHMASLFDRHLYEATNTVQAPSDSDLSANGLNMRSVLANASLAQSVGLNAASHEVSFEAVTGFVDTFVKADGLTPGRLINSVSGKREAN